MEEELKRLGEDTPSSLLPSSPAVAQASMAFDELSSPPKTEWPHGDDLGHFSALSHQVSPQSGTSELHEWELLSGHSAPVSPKSAKHSDEVAFEEEVAEDVTDAPSADAQDAEHHQGALAQEEEQVDVGAQHAALAPDQAMHDAEEAVAHAQHVEVIDLTNEDDEEQEDAQQDAVNIEQDEAEHDGLQQEEEAEGMVAGVSVPGSPQLRSGTSSFSHISSPASYRFGPSDAEDDGGRMGDDVVDDSSSDGEGSAWTSDEEGGREGRQSEADSEEAVADVVALSQEGSLGSLSDGEPSSSTTLLRRGRSGSPPPRALSFPEAAALALDLAALGGGGVPSPHASPATPADISHADAKNVEVAADAALRAAEQITAAVEAEFGASAAAAGSEDVPAADDDRACKGGKGAEAFPAAGGKHRADMMGALRAGLDRLAAVSGAALHRVASSEAVQRFWTCLQDWALALVACLPAAERARARLQLELARMRARARRVGWPQIALAASLAIMAIVAGCALVKNAALSRALRRKDNEMNQLILLVFKLQEGLQGAARGSRVPIVRHASCAMSSTFPLYDHLEPASIISF